MGIYLDESSPSFLLFSLGIPSNIPTHICSLLRLGNSSVTKYLNSLCSNRSDVSVRSVAGDSFLPYGVGPSGRVELIFSSNTTSTLYLLHRFCRCRLSNHVLVCPLLLLGLLVLVFHKRLRLL